MRNVTENISDKEHRWATRELQARVTPVQTAGVPALNATFLGQIAISAVGDAYIAIAVGTGAADWKQIT